MFFNEKKKHPKKKKRINVNDKMLISSGNRQHIVTRQRVYICCHDKVQAKGLAVSKREAKKGEKKRADSKQPRSKKCVITTKLWSKPTGSGPCRLGD